MCVRLFLEQGYKNTSVSQIVDEAGVARGSYLNLFPTKDRILLELTETMFGGQFGVARSIADSKLPPVYAYAVETAIQLTLTELNENLREIYIEAYSLPETSEYIYLHTTAELKQIFGEKFPDDTESDFYEMEIGTATCTAKAVCTVCGGEYGEMAAHSFTAEKAEAQYLKSAATCTEKAIYYKSCAVCGLSSEGTADEATFFSGNALDHNWGAWTSNEDGAHTRTCTVDGCSAGTQTENCIDANKDHKCDICDYIISECADDNKDHKCDYCGKKLTEHTGGKATCKDKAKCEVCGAEYGELDAKNHTNLKHFQATAATKTTEGNIEYWYCEGCGKYFSDKGGTKEIKKADTVTAKLKDDSKSPQTGDTSNLALWLALLFVSGCAAIGTTAVSRKKKYNR